MAIAILKIGVGDFETEAVPVILTIDDDNKQTLVTLPANPQLVKALNDYRQSYHDWGINYRLEVSPNIVTNVVIPMEKKFTELEKEFKKWLNHNNFSDIKNRLIGNAHFIDKVFIETDDIRLQMLPWNTLDDILGSLVNIDILMFKPISNCSEITLTSPVQILVILAIDDDSQNMIEKHLPCAEIIVLQKPSYKELCDKIDEIQHLDIIVFVGHSQTTDTFDDARIYINTEDHYTIYELQGTLENAIGKGLKLAIFNSCDGLGIVRQLNNNKVLNIPFVIVMREPVHNYIAQEFLNRLLKYFSEVNSLNEAFRKTKKFLLGFNKKHHNAAWLPLLFVNPNEPPLHYPSPIPEPLPHEDNNTHITEKKDEEDFPEPQPTNWQKIRQFLTRIKNFKLYLIFALSLIVALILSKIFFPNIPACDLDNTQDLLSCGATSLMERNLQDDKKRGLEYFGKGDYKNAIVSLEKSFNYTPNPETLLFLNNAKILKEFKEKKLNKKNIFPLAVAIPLHDNTSQNSSNYITSKYILQGVAFAQKQFNENPNNENKLLFVIANDKNDPADVANSTGEKVAEELVKRKLYAVMGHYSSRVTFYNKDIYSKNKLVFMSSSATASRLNSGQKLTFSKEENPYFFRVVSSSEKSAQKLADYLIENGVEKVNIFYAEQDLFSGSFGQRFKEYWEDNKGKTVKVASLQEDIILSELFNQSSSEKNAIVLCPGAFTQSISRNKETQNAIDIIINNNQNLPMGGCDVFTTQDYLKPIFSNKRNFIISAHSFNESIPTEFKSSFEKLFKHEIEPNEELIRTILAYDATNVLAEVLNLLSQKNTNFNSTDLQKYLLSGAKFKGISSEQISFQGSDPLKDTTRLIRPTEQSGKWQLVK